MLEVKGIDVFYGGFQALREVTLRVENGETVGLFGPNGHGKTTTLKAISGVLKPRHGTIDFNGVPIGRMAPERIVNMGIVHVPQGTHLFPDMTVFENLMLGAYTRAAWERRKDNLERVFQLLPRLNDRKNQKCSTLSGGERQMVAIGRGLMSSAKLLMLDEPTLGLAPKLARELVRKIMEIEETGISMILVEQNITYATELSDRMYLIENGEVSLEGGGEEILSNDYVKTAYLGISSGSPANPQTAAE